MQFTTEVGSLNAERQTASWASTATREKKNSRKEDNEKKKSNDSYQIIVCSMCFCHKHR